MKITANIKGHQVKAFLKKAYNGTPFSNWTGEANCPVCKQKFSVKECIDSGEARIELFKLVREHIFRRHKNGSE